MTRVPSVERRGLSADCRKRVASGQWKVMMTSTRLSFVLALAFASVTLSCTGNDKGDRAKQQTKATAAMADQFQSIVVVEDDDGMRRAIQRLLRAASGVFVGGINGGAHNDIYEKLDMTWVLSD